MNRNKLDQKIRALSSYPGIDADSAGKFGEIIANLGDWELFHINPLDFAEKYRFEAYEVVDLFVHSARIGLFDFSRNMICPSCRNGGWDGKKG